jgi:type I restriction enzyme S subunit
MTLRHLNCHDVIHLPTIVPPIEEQRAIVAQTETRLADLAAFASVLERQREALDQLERAVLAKAFRGAIVPQDPSDEPAEVMLARLNGANGGEVEKPKHGRRPRREEAALVGRRDGTRT